MSTHRENSPAAILHLRILLRPLADRKRYLVAVAPNSLASLAILSCGAPVSSTPILTSVLSAWPVVVPSVAPSTIGASVGSGHAVSRNIGIRNLCAVMFTYLVKSLSCQITGYDSRDPVFFLSNVILDK